MSFYLMVGQAKNIFSTKELEESMLKTYIFNDYFFKILVLQLLIFIVTGAIGAYLSSKRYMNQNA